MMVSEVTFDEHTNALERPVLERRSYTFTKTLLAFLPKLQVIQCLILRISNSCLEIYIVQNDLY